jgi:CRP/FNR family cyclic AMP-dependent transcriptional regulator
MGPDVEARTSSQPTTATTPAGPAARLAEWLDPLGLGARRLDLAAETTIYDADRPPENLYYINDGQIRVFRVAPDGSARLLEILGPGDWFGLPALSRRSAEGTRAVAVSRASLSELPARDLLAALPQYPSVAVELLGQLATKLHAAHAQAANLVFDDAEKRLVNALLQFSETPAASPAHSEEGGDAGVMLRITHQQLAQAVGAARETVSLALTGLRLQNLVRTGRNRLWFDPRALADYQRGRSAGAAAAPAAGDDADEDAG